MSQENRKKGWNDESDEERSDERQVVSDSGGWYAIVASLQLSFAPCSASPRARSTPYPCPSLPPAI